MAYTGSSAAILSNYDNVLKTFYLPAVRKQLNDDTYLKSILETNEHDVAGKDATINLHYGRNKGVMSLADGGAFADADYQKHLTTVVPMKYHYGRVTFSGPTIAATRDQKGSYARVIDNEITGIVKDLSQEVNRQLWGAGYGCLGRWRSTVSESGAASSYTLQKRYRNNSVGGDGFGSTFGGKYVEEIGGAAAVVCTFAGSLCSAAALATTDISVSAVDSSEDYYDTITCTDDSVSAAAGTFYVRPKNTVSVTSASSAGAQRYEMMGLRGIITDTNLDDIGYFNATAANVGFGTEDPLQGTDVDSYAWFKANVDTSSTRYGSQRALTFNLMQKMFDKVELKAGKDYGPDVVITTHAMRREYLDLCQADRRAVNTMKLDGGFTGLDYNGIPLMVDKDAIDGEIYFITSRDIQMYRMSDYDWMDKDGGGILARITGYDAYEAVLFRYAELGCSRRNSQGVIGDLAYTAT